MRRKSGMTLSFSTETKIRLRAYAEQNHTTVSQAITNWIWAQPVQQASPTRQQEQDAEIKKDMGVEEK